MSNNEHASPAIQICGDGALFSRRKSRVGSRVVNTRVPNHSRIIREICRRWLAGGTYGPDVVLKIVCCESTLVELLKSLTVVIVDVQDGRSRRIDGDGDHRRILFSLVVGDRVSKTVRAVETRVGCVGDDSRILGDAPVGRITETGDAEAASVRIIIIG